MCEICRLRRVSFDIKQHVNNLLKPMVGTPVIGLAISLPNLINGRSLNSENSGLQNCPSPAKRAARMCYISQPAVPPQSISEVGSS